MAPMEWLRESPHRRWNPLRQEWVLVSPNRTLRPWQGEVGKPEAPAPHYDPQCYLCPGNERAGGKRNPNYTGTFVFDNDYAALLPEVVAAPHAVPQDPLLRAEPERGICRVLCFHPDHALTLATLPPEAAQRVAETWQQQYSELRAVPWVGYVQIFENRGAMMGASNPHPHGQIWATEHVPDEPLRERAGMEAYAREHKGCLLCDYAQRELQIGHRLVCRNSSFAAVVPWWAQWPFETLVLPLEHTGCISDFSAAQLRDLADILQQVTGAYDRLFNVSFPYTMGFHQEPTPAAHFHAHFYPPLLRSATVRKFVVGFELLGTPQRDITPEAAAERLMQAAAG